jgi:cell division protein FtsI/penicillin-binding protein 2
MEAMKGRRGAAVAVDLATGDILVLASRPTIDADALRDRGGLDAAFRDPDLRLRSHRALRTRYPPGSTMKVVTAAAAAERARKAGAETVGTGLLSKRDATCAGHDRDLGVRDAGGARHGALDLTTALGKSCNIFFARTGVELGTDLQAMGTRMGFGEARSLVPWAPEATLTARPSHLLTCRSASGSGLPKGCAGVTGEAGLASVSPAWVARNPRLVARAAFGQTVVEATPMQMLEVAATVANEGRRPVFRLVDRIDGRCGDASCPLAIEGTHVERVLSRVDAATVRDGMVEAYRRGTASPKKLRLRLGMSGSRYTLERRPARPVAVAAKTGTAEVADAVDHSWFIVFAPADAPQVAVVTLIEHGGSGVATAGPIAMRVLRDALNAVKNP